MIKIPKWIKITWLICIPIGIFIAFFSESILKSAPEKQQALIAAKENLAVLTWFGQDTEITDHSDYPANVATSLSNKGDRHGKYCFRATGEKQHGKIVVEWISNREQQKFKVTRITQYIADGEKDPVIWTN